MSAVEACDDVPTTRDAAAGIVRQQWITEELVGINERRAVIEQAKGMLMFVYGIDADEAFTFLRNQSQNHNVKVNLLAEQIVKDLVESTRTRRRPDTAPASMGLIDTAHDRIRHGAERHLDGECKTGIPMTELGVVPE
ncbi:ANTAR domain-containing protein [Mycolicibacterium sediminis]|nr:ANTAR domain-containing protein [Mycolicibacterium sediminis]